MTLHGQHEPDLELRLEGAVRQRRVAGAQDLVASEVDSELLLQRLADVDLREHAEPFRLQGLRHTREGFLVARLQDPTDAEVGGGPGLVRNVRDLHQTTRSSRSAPAGTASGAAIATTSNAGGSSRWRFTEHWSTARRTASRYFSGKVPGSSISIRIRDVSLRSGSHSGVTAEPEALRIEAPAAGRNGARRSRRTCRSTRGRGRTATGPSRARRISPAGRSG